MAKHDLWGTPLDFFAVANDEFVFDLDAAAREVDALCRRYITPEMDALQTPWVGQTVWCNPPYTLIGPFVARASQQSQEQKNTVAILLPAYTDPKYWSDYVMQAHEIRFLKGRLKFRDGMGNADMSARFPSVLVIFKHIAGTHYGKAPHQWVWDWRKK